MSTGFIQPDATAGMVQGRSADATGHFASRPAIYQLPNPISLFLVRNTLRYLKNRTAIYTALPQINRADTMFITALVPGFILFNFLPATAPENNHKIETR